MTSPTGLVEFWRRYDAVEARLTAPLSERMLDLAGLRPGMRVLDLATGRGEPAVRAARRVEPGGRVVGIELSGPMLRMARARADREGVSNLDLRAANAEVPGDLPRDHFHVVTVRWGLMYMASPLAALVNAHGALLPQGILVAALWAEPERVPYYALPRRLLDRDRRLPPFDPEAPGTFRYADLDRVHRDFERAGFTIEHVEEMEVSVFEAESATEMVAWVRSLGLGELLNHLPGEDQRAWESALQLELERIRTDGTIRLGGVTRIVRASRRPASQRAHPGFC